MQPNVAQKNFDPELLIVGLDEVSIKRLVLRIFEFRCAICRHPAGTVHEIVPRARGKKSLTFSNRMAICNDCHTEEHRVGASPKRVVELHTIRTEYLIAIGKKSYV